MSRRTFYSFRSSLFHGNMLEEGGHTDGQTDADMDIDEGREHVGSSGQPSCCSSSSSSSSSYTIKYLQRAEQAQCMHTWTRGGSTACREARASQPWPGVSYIHADIRTCRRTYICMYAYIVYFIPKYVGENDIFAQLKVLKERR